MSEIIQTFCKRLGTIAAIVAFMAAVQSWGQEQGLKVGAKAPEFRLKAADGKEYALTELLKRGKVALVFYRSADW